MKTQWLPGARVHDLHPGIGNGPFQKLLGVVLHVNVDEHGTPASFWGNGNPDQVCPNFQVFKDGSIDQMLPFDWQPWCQVDGNFHYAAIETAGLPSEPLTEAQLDACARILRVYHDEFGVPFNTANRPGDTGLGIHAMGGQSWGGHSCPGQIRTRQRSTILLRAAALTHHTPPVTHPAPNPLPRATPRPTPKPAAKPPAAAPDGYRFRLVTSSQRTGPVWVFGAGTWRLASKATVAALTTQGQCDGAIHAVRDATLAELRYTATGRRA